MPSKLKVTHRPPPACRRWIQSARRSLPIWVRHLPPHTAGSRQPPHDQRHQKCARASYRPQCRHRRPGRAEAHGRAVCKSMPPSRRRKSWRTTETVAGPTRPGHVFVWSACLGCLSAVHRSDDRSDFRDDEREDRKDKQTHGRSSHTRDGQSSSNRAAQVNTTAHAMGGQVAK